MCPKKRRFAEKDTMGSRMGFRVFQRFFELTTQSTKPKAFDDFIQSQYYVAFVKFGRHVAELNPLYPDNFIDFVIKNGVKLKDWTKDYVYETYLEDLMQKEPAEKGLERTVVFMQEWSTENNTQFSEFFRTIEPTEASYLIKTGKISPWVLYLSSSAGELLDKFNEEQYKMIVPIINPGVWTARLTKNKDDSKFIKDSLKAVGL